MWTGARQDPDRARTRGHQIASAALSGATSAPRRPLVLYRAQGMSPTARRLLMGLLLLAAAGFARLGIWQLDRLRDRRARNVATLAARA